MFADRPDAGTRLASALERYRGGNAVVLALPRGGVPVAAQIARALALPLDLLIVRKIGVPGQPELAMGAVVDAPDPVVVRNEDVIRFAHVSEQEFDRVLAREKAEIARRRERYLRGRPHAEIAGRTAILVDDGIATGASVRAAIAGLRQLRPVRVVLAVPVAPPETVQSLTGAVDELVVIEQPPHFSGVGAHYRDFSQTEDEEVVAILDAAGAATRPPARC